MGNGTLNVRQPNKKTKIDTTLYSLGKQIGMFSEQKRQFEEQKKQALMDMMTQKAALNMTMAQNVANNMQQKWDISDMFIKLKQQLEGASANNQALQGAAGANMATAGAYPAIPNAGAPAAYPPLEGVGDPAMMGQGDPSMSMGGGAPAGYVPPSDASQGAPQPY